MDDTLTPADLDLLRRPLHGFFTVAAGPLPPQPRPVWFEVAEDGTIQLFTGPETLKVRRLRRDPRASLVVAAPAGEPEHWVAVSGPVTITTEDAKELAARLAARYWDLSDPTLAAAAEQMQADDQVRLILHPEQVRRFAV